MNHQDRIFCIKDIDSEQDLIEVMTNHKWPLCQAFAYNGFLCLNDGDNESEPEYSVLKFDRLEGGLATGKEIGRTKPLGMDSAQAKHFIRQMSQGNWIQDSYLKVRTEPEWHHSCALCRSEEY